MRRTKLFVAFLGISEIGPQEVSRETLTVQRMGANKALPHLALAQMGVLFLAFVLPVMMEQSFIKWASTASLGSWPGRTETTTLQSGQFGETRLYLLSSYLGHLWAVTIKCSWQNESSQC